MPLKSSKIKVAVGHLTKEQKYTIDVMLKNGTSKSAIAAAIGKDRSVIYREIARNKDKRSGEYRWDLADRKYHIRMKEKPKHKRFTEDIKTTVDELLTKDYSPEQIVGFSRKNGHSTVSHETIYQYVWEDKKKGGTLYKHLRSQGKRYRKRRSKKDNRGIIRNRVSIEQRPPSVEMRNKFGDLEGDLVMGKNHKSALVTVNDRSSGMLKMKKISSKNAKEVADALVDLVAEWSPFGLSTLTLDNGKEFANHEIFSETTGIDVYFAHPYHSWERGSNEHLNGLIRQYFPKKTDLSVVTEQRIHEVENILNSRPRKRYGFDSPTQRMENLLFNQDSVAFVT